MGRRRRTPEDSEATGSWLTTYSDLVTLLLCFFVLLFSMAIVDKQKFEQVALSVRSAFSGGTSIMKSSDADSMVSITPYEDGQKILDELADPDMDGKGNINEEPLDDTTGDASERWETIKVAKINIQELIDQMGLNENIKVIEEESRIILRLDSLILFDSGSADMKASAEPIMEKMGQVLITLDTEILVQGHADDRPIHTTLYPSNWELSTKRATNVVRFFVDDCGLKEEHLTAAGNAEFKPIAPNDTEYNRQKNRRIDIVILK